MSKTFEYKFVRLGEGRTSALFGPNGEGPRRTRPSSRIKPATAGALFRSSLRVSLPSVRRSTTS